MRHSRPSGGLILLGLALGIFSCPALSDEAQPAPDARDAASGDEAAPAEPRRFTFSWMFAPDDAMRPRGGTTRGPDVALDAQPSDRWVALQATGLTDQERDRRAILAMAGEFRTSFEFIETLGFTPGSVPVRPYQSWSTETVTAVADEPDFVSLQHIIVMRIQQEDGSLSEPLVMKHWRHDWRYEDRDLHEFAGASTWQHRRLDAEAVRGTWSQAVFQVDDSPRYESYGAWRHDGSASTWTSAETWRPLPRREASVRDNYHVLAGTNRFTVTATGWTHEQDNVKLVLEDGRPRAELPYLAREAGLNRYERIVGFDFAAGVDYWRKTGPYWAAVRDTWRGVFADRARFTLLTEVDGSPLFQRMFVQAAAFAEAPADDFPAQVERTVAEHLR